MLLMLQVVDWVNEARAIKESLSMSMYSFACFAFSLEACLISNCSLPGSFNFIFPYALAREDFVIIATSVNYKCDIIIGD